MTIEELLEEFKRLVQLGQVTPEAHVTITLASRPVTRIRSEQNLNIVTLLGETQ